jgi:hypothetical protein
MHGEERRRDPRRATAREERLASAKTASDARTCRKTFVAWKPDGPGLDAASIA